MSQEIEEKLAKIPVIRTLLRAFKAVKLPWVVGLTLYDLIEIYIIGIAEGALTYRAAAISFNFFMALFPFALFILNLLPFIPIENFQYDFLLFVEDSVPPQTFDAIALIINDILSNSNSGLLSTGFLLSILFMSNGLNAILGGFESSHHVIIKRSFLRQFMVSLALSVLLSLLLLFTVAAIVVFEVFIQTLKIRYLLSDKISLVETGRYLFVVLMILITVSILFKFGTKDSRRRRFITTGSIFTTILAIVLSYFFGIWVVQFSQYNELYGSIGTLLIIMIYIWINCMILLLGFELDATIERLKRKNLFE